MRVIESRIAEIYLKHYRKHLRKDIVSEISHCECIYKGSFSLLHHLGLVKENVEVETLVSRLYGNIVPHRDRIGQFGRDVYLLVLGVGPSYKYTESQRIPLLYQSGKFEELTHGTLITFNQNIDHALFWDRRIDIATFWINK